MARSRKTLFWFCSSAVSLDLVQAYYCNNDLCKENEYCCGDNICCVSYTVWELWYFWFGIVFFMVLLSTCMCLWRSGFRERIIYFKTASPAYSPLSYKQPHTQSSSSYSDDYVSPTERDFGYPSTNHHHHNVQMAPPAYDEVVQTYGGQKGPH